MTGLARYDEDLESTDRFLAVLKRQAEALAKSNLVPAVYKDRPDDIAAVGLSLRALGAGELNLNTLKNCFVIDGAVSFSAQLQVGLMRSRGHEMWFDEDCDDVKATVNIRLQGEQRIHRFSYTVDMARRAGLLDEWVEKWNPTQNGKKWCERVIVAVDGVRVDAVLPDWAQKELENGRVKRKDPWFKGREGMLMCRAATRGIGKTCPEVLLGIDSYDGPPPTAPRAPAPAAAPGPGDTDDDIDDAEVLDDVHDSHTGEPRGEPAPPPGDDGAADEGDGGPAAVANPTDGRGGQDSTAAASEPVSADEAGGVTEGSSSAAAAPSSPRPPLVDTGWSQRFSIACRELGLDRGQKLGLIAAALGRRVESSKEIAQGAEAEQVTRWFVAIKNKTHELVRTGDEWTIIETNDHAVASF